MVVLKDDSLAKGIAGLGTTLSNILQQKSKERAQQNLIERFTTPQIPQGASEEIQDDDVFQPLSEGELLSGEVILPGSSQVRMKADEQRKKQFEDKKLRDRYKRTLSSMIKNIKSTGPQKGLQKYGLPSSPEIRRSRQNFDSLGAVLAQIGKEMESKGMMSKAIFEDLVERRLPSSSKTQAENMGSIEGWANVLNIPMKDLLPKSSSKLKKVKSGTKLTREIAEQILDKSDNNPEKARKRAKQLGYDVG